MTGKVSNDKQTIVDLENRLSLSEDILKIMSEELQNAITEKEHWIANHDTEVSRARVLKERIDMPLERVKAYEQIGELTSDIRDLRATVKTLINLYGNAKVQKYKHYKGGIYELVCTSKLESSPNITLITYKATDGTIWTRPEHVFFEIIDNNGEKVQRFVPI